MTHRTQINFLIDLLAFMAFCLLIATGLLIRYVLPPGTGQSLLLWGLNRHEWGNIHFWLALFISVVMVLHLYLHWQWIVRTIKGREGSRIGIRVGLVITLALLLIFAGVLPFFLPLEHTGCGGSEHGNHDTVDASAGKIESGQEKRGLNKLHISGSTTLQVICDQTGLDSGVLLDALGLPQDTHLEERLGRLKQREGLEIEKVRRTIDALLQK